MLLSVKRLGASTAPYEVQLFLKPPRLADLKEALLEQSGVPIWAQRVFLEGRCLRSTRTLEEQGVTADGSCTLHFAASAHYKAPVAPAAEVHVPTPEAASSSSMHADTAPDVSAGGQAATSAQAESPERDAAEPAAAEVDLSALSVADLKQQLKDRGVSYEGCTEKSDLVDLLRECIATGRYERQEPPPRAAPSAGPGFQGPGAAPFAGFNGGGFAQGGIPGAGQPNPLAAFFSQLGPMMGTAMNQAFAQAQQQPPVPGGAAMPGVPPAGVPTAGAPFGFAGFPQQSQQQQPGGPWAPVPGMAWAPAPGSAGPPPMPASVATLLQQLGPQIASQMGTPPNQSQDFGDITFTTDMNFVMAPPVGAAGGAGPTIDLMTPEAGGTGTQSSATAGARPPDDNAADGVEEGGHQF